MTQENNQKIPNLHPGLYETGENLNENKVNLKNQDEMIYYIVSHTGLSYETIKIILEAYFQEVRRELIMGNKLYLFPLGFFKFVKSKKYFIFRLLKKIRKEFKFKAKNEQL